MAGCHTSKKLITAGGLSKQKHKNIMGNSVIKWCKSTNDAHKSIQAWGYTLVSLQDVKKVQNDSFSSFYVRPDLTNP